MRRTVDLPGGRFRYLEAGAPDMPLVLCLHGFPDHPAGFEGLLGTLAEAGYRAVAPFMRGYSPSITTGPFDIDRLSADVLELIDALAFDQPVTLVGHDWGTLISYSVAPALGDRLRTSIAMALPHPLAFLGNLRRDPGQLMRSRYLALFQLGRISERVVWANDFRYVDELWRKWSPGFEMSPDHRARLKSCLAASMPGPLGYYRDLIKVRSLRAVRRARAKTIPQPFLYLHGARDACIDIEMATGQERYFDKLEVEVIPEVGHFLHHEAPRLVTDRVLSWLREH